MLGHGPYFTALQNTRVSAIPLLPGDLSSRITGPFTVTVSSCVVTGVDGYIKSRYAPREKAT